MGRKSMIKGHGKGFQTRKTGRKAGGKVIAKMGTRKGFKGAVKGKRVNDAFAELLAQIKAELPKKSTRKFKSAAISQKLADKRETEYEAAGDAQERTSNRSQELQEHLVHLVVQTDVFGGATPDCRLAYLKMAKQTLAALEAALVAERKAEKDFQGAYLRMWGDVHGEIYSGRKQPLQRDVKATAKLIK